jgi:hypothetical protein
MTDHQSLSLEFRFAMQSIRSAVQGASDEANPSESACVLTVIDNASQCDLQSDSETSPEAG